MEEDILSPLVGDQKAKAIRMALYTPTHQIHALNQPIGPTPVFCDLSIP